jgi:phosphohistidine phosphatase SixA
MKSLNISLLIIIFFLNTFPLYSSEQPWAPAKEGDKVIFIRHSLAPGGGDPSGFEISNCKTQRNLNQAGINQSKKIGKLFKEKKISIDQVLSSQWCRCKDTAKFAFGNYKEYPALNSTFQHPFNKNEEKQLKEISQLVKDWDGKGKNLILVTHYSIIVAITGSAPSSGGIVITDKNFNVISTIDIN